MKKTVREYLTEIGRRGGSRTSRAKRKAVRANLVKARAARAERGGKP